MTIYNQTEAWAKQTIFFALIIDPDYNLIEDQSRAKLRTESIFDQISAAVEKETQSRLEMRPTALILRVLDWVAENHNITPPEPQTRPPDR